jgi:hypothetical protein
MDVICREDEGGQIVTAMFRPCFQGFLDQDRYCFLAQKHRTPNCLVQFSVHKDEGFSRGQFGGRLKLGGSECAVEVPGQEEPAAFRIYVGEAACGVHVD